MDKTEVDLLADSTETDPEDVDTVTGPRPETDLRTDPETDPGSALDPGLALKAVGDRHPEGIIRQTELLAVTNPELLDEGSREEVDPKRQEVLLIHRPPPLVDKMWPDEEEADTPLNEEDPETEAWAVVLIRIEDVRLEVLHLDLQEALLCATDAEKKATTPTNAPLGTKSATIVDAEDISNASARSKKGLSTISAPV